MEKFILISEEYENTRIDRWIKKNIARVPQSFIEKNLRNKSITINKVKVQSSYKLKVNDKIFLQNFNPKTINLPRKKKYIPTKRDVKESTTFIVENNDNFCVINKPHGLAVQGGTKINKNLIDLISNNPIFNESKPYIVHRLDKETSGVIIIAKNRKYAQLFTSLFRIRRIHKTYISVCHGELDKPKGILNDDLVRYDSDRKIIEKAITHYKVLDKNTKASLLLLNPITGRKHQIRKHLSKIGFPIIGDEKYNFSNSQKYRKSHLMLHAYSIKFVINDKKYEFTVDIPDYFKKILQIKRLTLFKNS